MRVIRPAAYNQPPSAKIGIWTPPAIGGAFNQFDARTGTFSALDQQRTSNAANEITAIGATVGDVWQTPAYDRNGNMATIPKPSDMTAGYAGVWDAWNRLVGLYDGDTLVQGNAYDGLARRTKIVLADETLDDYYTAAWQLFQEDSTVADTTIFYWGLRYIDDLIARYTIDGDSIFSLPDANWYVVAIADTSAAVLERYAYTPYGVVLFLNNDFEPLSGNLSAYNWKTLYCGYRYDSEVGLYIVRNRWLNAPLACWLSVDPIDTGDDANPYRYCQNCPTCESTRPASRASAARSGRGVSLCSDTQTTASAPCSAS